MRGNQTTDEPIEISVGLSILIWNSRKIGAVKKQRKTGRKRYDPVILLKVILFAFMEYGYASVREIEKLCKTVCFGYGLFSALNGKV